MVDDLFGGRRVQRTGLLRYRRGVLSLFLTSRRRRDTGVGWAEEKRAFHCAKTQIEWEGRSGRFGSYS